jgi:YebC/PmpR family DNA-binding regulatory protein
MGRHATVAGRQASSAAAKARKFAKLTREIMVAARTGTDPGTNSRLRLAVDRAKDNSMPKENIERAVKKGAGEAGGAAYEELMYEGYGPGGSAILVECLTDNRNRTNPEVRRIFQKNGGNMGEMGSVAWMFKRKGVFVVAKSNMSEDKIMDLALEAGAEDVVSNDDGTFTVTTEVNDFSTVRTALLGGGLTFERAELEMIPETEMGLEGENAKQALELVDKLEEHDDVQTVSFNFTVPEN